MPLKLRLNREIQLQVYMIQQLQVMMKEEGVDNLESSANEDDTTDLCGGDTTTSAADKTDNADNCNDGVNSAADDRDVSMTEEAESTYDTQTETIGVACASNGESACTSNDRVACACNGECVCASNWGSICTSNGGAADTSNSALRYVLNTDVTFTDPESETGTTEAKEYLLEIESKTPLDFDNICPTEREYTFAPVENEPNTFVIVARHFNSNEDTQRQEDSTSLATTTGTTRDAIPEDTNMTTDNASNCNGDDLAKTHDTSPREECTVQLPVTEARTDGAPRPFILTTSESGCYKVPNKSLDVSSPLKSDYGNGSNPVTPVKSNSDSNGDTITGNGATITGNGDTITRNGATITGNGATITDNGATITGNGATITGNGATITGNEATITSTGTITSNGDTVTGKGTIITGTGNAVTGTGNAVTGNGALITSNGDAVTGNGAPITDNGDTVTGNGSCCEDSKAAGDEAVDASRSIGDDMNVDTDACSNENNINVDDSLRQHSDNFSPTRHTNDTLLNTITRKQEEQEPEESPKRKRQDDESSFSSSRPLNDTPCQSRPTPSSSSSSLLTCLAKGGRGFVAPRLRCPYVEPPNYALFNWPRAPFHFRHCRSKHIPQMNALARQCFWPGIDREYL